MGLLNLWCCAIGVEYFKQFGEKLGMQFSHTLNFMNGPPVEEENFIRDVCKRLSCFPPNSDCTQEKISINW